MWGNGGSGGSAVLVLQAQAAPPQPVRAGLGRMAPSAATEVQAGMAVRAAGWRVSAVPVAWGGGSRRQRRQQGQWSRRNHRRWGRWCGR